MKIVIVDNQLVIVKRVFLKEECWSLHQHTQYEVKEILQVYQGMMQGLETENRKRRNLRPVFRYLPVFIIVLLA